MSDEKTPVTLEGIAAVLAVVPALIGQAPEKARQSALADALGMLSHACVMAGGKKAPPGMDGNAASSADSDAYVTGYNRAVTDAHNAMADVFGIASEDPNGPRAQAAMARPEPTWEECHGAIDTLGVPRVGEDGRILSVRERIRLLERQCSDALDEYASFRVMGGEVKTLPERIRLLGDSWQRVKTAHAEAEEQVSRLLSEAPKRETAARDAALDEVKEAVTIPYRVADPAARHSELVARIDALKSKPAPVLTPEQERELAERREAREEAVRRLDALAMSDVHDFGWALAQMRAGRMVRRPSWDAGAHVFIREGGWLKNGGLAGPLDGAHILATDWEVVE